MTHHFLILLHYNSPQAVEIQFYKFLFFDHLMKPAAKYLKLNDLEIFFTENRVTLATIAYSKNIYRWRDCNRGFDISKETTLQ